ncbi:hypothetical protein GGR44_001072 [Sphingobium fontiphilum]|uniref:Uncharacterized protein n=1 Tax=Sphingobium fontiphilum TaxID=944425 RepID=A0A7W6GN47_9SPHN|nr:hypothetical protein [Sphingobium fontiphilum]
MKDTGFAAFGHDDGVLSVGIAPETKGSCG